LAHPEQEEGDMSEPASPPRPRGAELLATLAERVGAQLKSETVYGPPVERDGVTVVPVAAARFGIGAGSGIDPSKQQEGEGGGAGGTITPTGYIEIKDGRSRYVPIVHPARMVALIAGAIVTALLIMRPQGRQHGRTPWRVTR
jgi:uncharacterized spore protein YtfJ